MEVIDNVLIRLVEGINQKIEAVYMGQYYTAVKTKKIGLAFTYKSCFKVPHLCPPIRNAGNLCKLKAKNLAEYLRSSNTLEATIGLATINSLLPVPDEYASGNAIPLIVDLCRNRKVAMVGYFPFAERIQEVAADFFVTEKNRNADEESVCSEDVKHFIKRAEVRIITATTLINHSFDSIMEMSKNGFNALFGPTSPLTPELLKHNIDFIAGVLVEKEEHVIRSVCEGALVPQMKGLRPVCIAKDKSILKKLPEGDFINFLKKEYPKFQV